MKNYFLAVFTAASFVACTSDIEEIAVDQPQEEQTSELAAKTLTVSGTYARVRRNTHHINNNIWSRDANSKGTGNQSVWSYDINNWGTYGSHSRGDNQIKSYPSLIIGKHYGDGPNSSQNMPIRIRDVRSAVTNWSTQCNFARGNTSYDIWFDNSKNPSGENDYELMIWLNRKNLNPIAHRYDANGAVPRFRNVKIGNYRFNVYEATVASGLRVFTFLSTSNRNSVSNLNIKSFANYVINKGWMKNSVYMTSVQAGFEIVEGRNFDCKATKFSLNVRKN